MHYVGERINNSQDKRNHRVNRKKDNPTEYESGNIVYGLDKQVKAKQKPLYKREIMYREKIATDKQKYTKSILKKKSHSN